MNKDLEKIKSEFGELENKYKIMKKKLKREKDEKETIQNQMRSDGENKHEVFNMTQSDTKDDLISKLEQQIEDQEYEIRKLKNELN